MAESKDSCKIQSKRKAITAFFPYAVWKGREGGRGLMVMEAFLSVVKISSSTTSLWHPIMPFISDLFNAASTQTILLTSPHVPWDHELRDVNAVRTWANAVSEVSALPHSEAREEICDENESAVVEEDPEMKEVERRVVDALLHIASVDPLREHIPNETWTWLNRRPSLPPMCQGRSSAKKKHVVSWVRGLRDADILTSYLLLVWSEWDPILPRRDLSEMRMTVSREFRGVRMEGHRECLIDHLNHVLRELDRGLGYFKQFKLWVDWNDIQLAKAQYGELRDKLMELDRRERGIPTCKPFALIAISSGYSPSWMYPGLYSKLFRTLPLVCGGCSFPYSLVCIEISVYRDHIPSGISPSSHKLPILALLPSLYDISMLS